MTFVSNTTEMPREAVLAAFGIATPPTEWAPLESTGFSGARLWCVRFADRDPLVIRRFPTNVTGERLAEIHVVVRHVATAGCDFVPVPLECRDRSVSAFIQGALWQIEPLLPGAADFSSHPTAARLDSAMQALAQWHRAAATFAPARLPGHAAGIVLRRKRLSEFWAGKARQMVSSICWDEDKAAFRAELEPLLAEAVGQFEAREAHLARQLELAVRLTVAQQFCIRDIWHDHVLFDGDQVSGIVDYDALRVDSVAADISRLLGSLLAGTPADWQAALATYQSVRRLSEDELQLVSVYDQANTLLSGLQWLKWLAVEDRSFDWPRVARRLRTIVERFP